MSSDIKVMDLIYYPNNKYSLGSKGRKLSIYNQDESKPSPKIKQLLREGAETPPDFKFVYNSENLKQKNEFILRDKMFDKRNTKNPKLKAKFSKDYEVVNKQIGKKEPFQYADSSGYTIKVRKEVKVYDPYNLQNVISRTIIEEQPLLNMTRTEHFSNFDITESSFTLKPTGTGDIDVVDAILIKLNDNKYNRVSFNWDTVFISTSIETSTKKITRESLIELLQSLYSVNLLHAEITISSYNIPSGGNYKTLDPYLEDKKGFIKVDNTSNDLCGQICITYSLLSDKKLREYVDGKRSYQKQLSEVCDVLGDELMSFTDFDKYKEAQVFIVVRGNNIIYNTEPAETGKKIYIYYDSKNEHYHYINNINLFTDNCNNYKWCFDCNKSVKKNFFTNHKCVEFKCMCCKVLYADKEQLDNHYESNEWVTCGDCNQRCPGIDCLTIHNSLKQGTHKACEGRWKCDDCNKWMDKDHLSNHICGEQFCLNCQTYHCDSDHRCFVQTLELKECKTEHTYMVFDFESAFDENNNHIVNYVVVNKLYNDTYEKTFTTLSEFGDFVLKQKNTTMIAHNGKAYDTWMLYKYFITKTGVRPNKTYPSW